MVGDPRPALRIADPQAGIAKLKAEGRCRACGHHSFMLSRHHLVPKGQGGDDLDENIIPLCGNGTQGCHGAMTDHTNSVGWPSKLEGYEWQVVASAIRSSLWSTERMYIVRTKGEDWLNRNLPYWDR